MKSKQEFLEKELVKALVRADRMDRLNEILKKQIEILSNKLELKDLRRKRNE